MIKNFLRKLGYIHKSELTDQVILEILSESIGFDPTYDFPKDVERKMFEDLSAVDGLHDYLRYTASKDMQRHFSAEDDRQRDTIHGAFLRTVYLKTQVSKPKDNKVTKIPSLRYGK
jgi:hypothetical protein